jgi:hypothetical protein
VGFIPEVMYPITIFSPGFNPPFWINQSGNVSKLPERLEFQLDSIFVAFTWTVASLTTEFVVLRTVTSCCQNKMPLLFHDLTSLTVIEGFTEEEDGCAGADGLDG